MKEKRNVILGDNAHKTTTKTTSFDLGFVSPPHHESEATNRERGQENRAHVREWPPLPPWPDEPPWLDGGVWPQLPPWNT